MFIAGRRSLMVAATVAAVTASVLVAPQAFAAGEVVNVYLTTTSDSRGRTVTRGLQRQTPIAFGGSGSANQTVTVDENTTYQQFEGAGASFTDTAAYDIKGSGALSAATQSDVLTKLFSPAGGIGVSALRNVIGSSDLAQNSYSYDTTCCDLGDFSLSRDGDIMALTKKAVGLNPAMLVMASPWSAPPWTKDNNAYSQGYLQAQYYSAYAKYVVKYIQGYQAQGVPIRYVTEQNEPGCCAGYPSMQWNASGLDYFAANDLLPALQSAGLGTKLLIGDWNFDTYDAWVAPLINDAAIRNHPNFGGIAWHDYAGSPSEETTVHNLFPGVNIPNVAFKNPDGSKALIVYNTSGSAQSIKVNWGGRSFAYSLPAKTSATFTWSGTQAGSSSKTGTITGLGGKCLDVANNSTVDGAVVHLWDCYDTVATQKWAVSAGGLVNGASGKCLDVKDNNFANGAKLQIWTCTGAANQRWIAPA